MRRGFRRALEHLSMEEHIGSVMIPDMTENLLAQPNWISEEQRIETAHQTARLMLEAILSCRDLTRNVKIWIWNPDNTQAFIDEMDRLVDEEEAEHSPADEAGTIVYIAPHHSAE
jgi:hypothetical protein